MDWTWVLGIYFLARQPADLNLKWKDPLPPQHRATSPSNMPKKYSYTFMEMLAIGQHFIELLVTE
jgi:hypothetical protein